jgi:hypothetical protein
MASGQVVRRRTLDAEIEGSTPSSPAMKLLQMKRRSLERLFVCLPMGRRAGQLSAAAEYTGICPFF